MSETQDWQNFKNVHGGFQPLVDAETPVVDRVFPQSPFEGFRARAASRHLSTDWVDNTRDQSSQNRDRLTGTPSHTLLAGNFQTDFLTRFSRKFSNSPKTRFSTTKIKPLGDMAPVKDPLLGIYYGNQGFNMDQVKALEAWQGKQNAVINMFTNWADDSTTLSNLFKQQLPNIWNNKNIPLITWEPFLGLTATPDDIEVRIARGDYDTYIHRWADQLNTFLSGPDGVAKTGDDRRAYLRLAHEMNGDWYPWGAAMGNNSPADYVRMWQHVKTLFDGKGMDASQLQWVWNINNLDVGGHQAESFYPGDAYVNWVAIDGYNWGTSQLWSSWQTPEQVFGSMLTRLRTLTTKPIGLTEVASSSATHLGTNLSAKSQWITDTYHYAVAQGIKMVCWFNEDKETDWAIFGGQNGDGTFKYNRKTYKRYKSYQSAVASKSYSSSDPTNPRLLSDTFFWGLMA